MAYKKTNPLIKIIAIPVVVIILGIALIAIFSGHSNDKANIAPKKEKNTDAATGDTPVETLKTLTAQVNKVENQNKKLIAQNDFLKQKDERTLADWKGELLAKVKDEVSSGLDSSSQATKNQLQNVVSRIENKDGSESIPIGGNRESQQFIWISDISVIPTANGKSNSKLKNMASLLNPDAKVDSGSDSKEQQKPQPIPYYTIPQNTILTGATALQPLIGRTPQDGKVTDPYTFSVVFGPKSIAANSAQIPQEIHGIIASGVATGDAMGHCVRGNITSMTFIFPDGRVATIGSEDSKALGTIAGRDGNPCIPGVFHTNAGKVVLGTGIFAGLQGYGAGISEAETSSVTSLDTKTSIATVVGNANKYALGQGVSTMGQEMLEWWNERMKNYFDFVYVPNYDPKQGGPLKLNIKINKEIDINYDQNGRKVRYEYNKDTATDSQLD